MNAHTMQDLKQMQNMPLEVKIALTESRIRSWVSEFGEDGVYVSFSGGKDSTVLLHIVRNLYPDIPAVFVDTGLEYPEIRNFVKTFDNVIWLKPDINFKKVINDYGYPIISKEVSEVVEGARRYLTALSESNNIITDRQTDRQTDRIIPYSYDYRRICGIGEYSQQRLGKSKRKSTKNGSTDGNVIQDRDGDYP